MAAAAHAESSSAAQPARPPGTVARWLARLWNARVDISAPGPDVGNCHPHVAPAVKVTMKCSARRLGLCDHGRKLGLAAPAGPATFPAPAGAGSWAAPAGAETSAPPLGAKPSAQAGGHEMGNRPPRRCRCRQGFDQCTNLTTSRSGYCSRCSPCRCQCHNCSFNPFDDVHAEGNTSQAHGGDGACAVHMAPALVTTVLNSLSPAARSRSFFPCSISVPSSSR